MAKPFIATRQIFIDGALGYVPGDEVPDQVVADHSLAESVSREGTKAADAATAAITPATPATPPDAKA